MAISDYIISFVADLIGVLLGVWLGYLLGLRQQRTIDSEKDSRRRVELGEALRNELAYVSKEVGRRSEGSSGFFNDLAFTTVYLDLPTFTSIVNSGQLLLLDQVLIRSLRELNT
jgi:hypothetical protein